MKIFVTRQIPGDYLKRLSEAGHDVTISKFDRSLTQEELLENIKGVDVILSVLTDRIDGEVIDAAGPQLKAISNYAVGFDNINMEDATHRGVVVTNTPCDEVNIAVAEHTWALILCLARHIIESDEFVRQQGYYTGKGGYKGWEPQLFMGHSLVGKTLGVVGLGRIGSMVARLAKGYNMTVLYNKHEPDKEAEKELGIKFSSLDELLPSSDIVSIHVPLTDETRGMFNTQTFEKMKQGSFLVNTARGPIIKEQDLVEALKSKKLEAAGLDVFESEPNINPELLSLPNVILTPHIASATIEARYKMSELAVQAILDLAENKKPQNLANPDVWDKRRK